jgi:hypothetical protein
MKQLIFVSLLIVAALGLVIAPASAQEGVRIVCPNGQVIENGIEVIVNMRPGFTYTATAVGINGFDPVLAVSDQGGTSLCADDESAAFTYSADLPTTDFVPTSSLSSQVPFSHSYDGLADISITVGGFDNADGEFILILEGMVVTTADGSGPESGDPISVHITPNVTASGVPISVYMIAVTSALDPYMKVMGEDGLPFVLDDGTLFACDDAGNPSLCWGESESLSGTYISRTSNRRLPGGSLDAMMVVPTEELGLGPNDEGYLTWNMTTVNNETFGDYVVVFHLGTGSGSSTGSASSQSSGMMDSSGDLHQWASDASGTSQYGTDSWSFAQATGAPNTDDCGDIRSAWASSSSTGSDILTLEYDVPVLPSEINIYQTYNPGSIIKVEVGNSGGGAPVTLRNSADAPGNTPCPGIFSVDASDVDILVDRVIIYLDQSIGGSWNEIDAVELVGSPALDADA